MRKMNLLVAGAALLALATVPGRAAAQASGQITATAQIAVAVSVTAGNNLDFGVVIPGFTKVIATTDATAGTFQIDGGAGAEVLVTFPGLPTDLVSGGNLLPVTFTGVHNTANAAAGGTPFAVGGGFTTPLNGTGSLYVFLGGTADATLQTNAGVYNATITLNAAYTGN